MTQAQTVFFPLNFSLKHQSVNENQKNIYLVDNISSRLFCLSSSVTPSKYRNKLKRRMNVVNYIDNIKHQETAGKSGPKHSCKLNFEGMMHLSPVKDIPLQVSQYLHIMIW